MLIKSMAMNKMNKIFRNCNKGNHGARPKGLAFCVVRSKCREGKKYEKD